MSPVFFLQELLERLHGAAEILVSQAGVYEGLFPSILDLETMEIPAVSPRLVPKFREQDRAHFGFNLLLDLETFAFLRELGARERNARFSEAPGQAIERFVTHCTGRTLSGLFPWGEHAYWNLLTDSLGNPRELAGKETAHGALHDHLRRLDVSFWEEIHAIRPEAVREFANGLNWHWKEGEPPEYWRHAYMEKPRHPARKPEEDSSDFPRHGGIYLVDWLFAYVKFGDPAHLAQAKQMTDYWWADRDSDTGLLPAQHREEQRERDGRALGLSVNQTLANGTHFLCAARLLQESGIEAALADVIRERGTAYAMAILNCPHAAGDGRVVQSINRHTHAPTFYKAFWNGGYGGQSSPVGLVSQLLEAYDFLGETALLDLAQDILMAAADRFPHDSLGELPASDAANFLLGAVAVLERRSDDKLMNFLEEYTVLFASKFFDRPLPRAAVGREHYENKTGSSALLLGFLRAARMLESNLAPIR